MSRKHGTYHGAHTMIGSSDWHWFGHQTDDPLHADRNGAAKRRLEIERKNLDHLVHSQSEREKIDSRARISKETFSPLRRAQKMQKLYAIIRKQEKKTIVVKD